MLNIITPFGGIEFQRNKIFIGDNVGKIYAVIKYPPSIEMGWAAKISNIPRAITCQSFEPCDNGALIEYLSRSAKINRGIANSSRDPLERQRAEKASDDAEKLMYNIDQIGETVGYMVNLIMPIGKDEEALERISRTVESVISVMKCKARVLGNLQEQGLKAISPYHTTIDEISNIAKRNVPISTFAGGFPFASNGYSDREGYYFAKDSGNGLIILDIWKREGDRTNTNFVIMGVPGTGKSATAKHIMLSEYALGTKIIVIDFENEYKDMCKNLGGDYIDCAGGSGGKINPLQIRPVPKDYDEDSKECEKDILYGKDDSIGAMALHFKNLEIFFSLYMINITEIQKALLKKNLEELYGLFGITWNTDISNRKNEDFPTFMDLYKLLLDKEKATDEDANLKDVIILIRELAEGADSFLFQGHTTINPKSKFICLNTFNLQNSSDALKKTQYFNMLTWAWEQMSKNRNEKVLLVADEAYLLIDPQVPQSLIFLRNVAKRARKYEAGIMIISHSVVDFLSPEVRMYGQALLDTPTYKLMFGTDGQNLKESSDLYGLTEIEQDHLFNKKRGYAIFMVGSKRLFVKFEIPPYKFRYMGKGGGR